MNHKLTTAIVLALILTLGLAVTAIAQGNDPGTNGQCLQGEFIDADGDGVCDNAAQNGAGMQFQRSNGNRGNAAAGNMGNGLAFTDADGDEVCDNYSDADGDGVSDNRAGPQGRGRRGSQARGEQVGMGRNIQGRQAGFGQGANQ